MAIALAYFARYPEATKPLANRRRQSYAPNMDHPLTDAGVFVRFIEPNLHARTSSQARHAYERVSDIGDPRPTGRGPHPKGVQSRAARVAQRANPRFQIVMRQQSKGIANTIV